MILCVKGPSLTPFPQTGDAEWPWVASEAVCPLWARVALANLTGTGGCRGWGTGLTLDGGQEELAGK